MRVKVTRGVVLGVFALGGLGNDLWIDSVEASGTKENGGFSASRFWDRLTGDQWRGLELDGPELRAKTVWRKGEDFTAKEILRLNSEIESNDVSIK